MLREKTQDVKDLGHRILHNLFGKDAGRADYEGHVVISEESPAVRYRETVAQRAAGSYSRRGVTSHVAILARSLQLPMVIVRDRAFCDPENTMILMDADQGNVLVNPGPEVIGKYESLKKPADAPKSLNTGAARHHHAGRRTRAADGEHQPAERLEGGETAESRRRRPVPQRTAVHRPERFPSEEEQYRIYRTIVDEMAGKEVVFRTLDIGGDKMLSYFPSVNEANPFLGLRAIRFSLRHKEFSPNNSAPCCARARAADAHHVPAGFVRGRFHPGAGVVAECSRDLRGEGIAHAGTRSWAS